MEGMPTKSVIDDQTAPVSTYDGNPGGWAMPAIFVTNANSAASANPRKYPALLKTTITGIAKDNNAVMANDIAFLFITDDAIKLINAQ